MDAGVNGGLDSGDDAGLEAWKARVDAGQQCPKCNSMTGRIEKVPGLGMFLCGQCGHGWPNPSMKGTECSNR
jgi:hypothetical protein